MTSPGTRVQGQWTYHDLDSLPDDIKRYELWDGELIIMPAPSIRHQILAKRLFKALITFDPDETRGEYLFAPSDVVLEAGWTAQPDVLFISNQRRYIIQYQRIVGGPDFVAEVLSPRTTQRDRINKRSAYAAAGVTEYWLIDAEASTITVLDLRDGEYVERGVFGVGDTVTSRVLDGLSLDVGSLFADLPQEN